MIYIADNFPTGKVGFSFIPWSIFDFFEWLFFMLMGIKLRKQLQAKAFSA